MSKIIRNGVEYGKGSAAIDDESISAETTFSSKKITTDYASKEDMSHTVIVYVDQINGSDDNDGLTEDKPLKNITIVPTLYPVATTRSMYIVLLSDISYDEFTSVSLGYGTARVYPIGCDSAYTEDFSKNKKLKNVRLSLGRGSVSIYNIDFESDKYTTSTSYVAMYSTANSAININKCRFTNLASATKSATSLYFMRTAKVFFQNSEFHNFKYAMLLNNTSASFSVEGMLFDNCAGLYLMHGAEIFNFYPEDVGMLNKTNFTGTNIVYTKDGLEYINGIPTNTYSTKEVAVGTYLDKTLYRKCIVVQDTSSGEIILNNIKGLAPNLDVISITGTLDVLNDGQYTFPVPYCLIDNKEGVFSWYRLYTYYDKATGDIIFSGKSSVNEYYKGNFRLKLTIEYTKN